MNERQENFQILFCANNIFINCTTNCAVMRAVAVNESVEYLTCASELVWPYSVIAVDACTNFSDAKYFTAQLNSTTSAALDT